MIEKLAKYENLGTPQFYWELFHLLQKSNQRWTYKSIIDHFYNRIIDGRAIFDGCITLLLEINAIQIDKESLITINSFEKDLFKNKEIFNELLLRKIIVEASKDKIFGEIFKEENISYDTIHHFVLISHSAFLFKYSNFKQLLLDFQFLSVHTDKRIEGLVLNSHYQEIFKNEILYKIGNQALTKNQFDKSLIQREIYGEEAEIFVLEYERSRLNNQKDIVKMSDYNVNAGYDILSYNNINSKISDRFIEVKSYSGQPHFYWSRNEIKTSHVKRKSYFLYLVDRMKMNEKDYIPLIISNPYDEIMKNNKWDKIVESYLVSPK
jgi:hypothetical protein